MDNQVDREWVDDSWENTWCGGCGRSTMQLVDHYEIVDVVTGWVLQLEADYVCTECDTQATMVVPNFD